MDTDYFTKDFAPLQLMTDYANKMVEEYLSGVKQTYTTDSTELKVTVSAGYLKLGGVGGVAVTIPRGFQYKKVSHS